MEASVLIEISSKSKILLISADSDVLLLGKRVIKKAGFSEITTEASGIAALQLCAKSPFDIVVCDQNCRFLTGWLFIQEFKMAAAIANTTVVLLGRGKCPVGTAELKAFGVPGYLKFPFVLKEFMALISSGLSDIKTNGSTEYIYTDAKKALIANESDKAVVLYQNLQSATNDSLRSSIGLAQAFEQKNEVAKAEQVIKNLEAANNDSPTRLMMSIRIDLKSRNLQKAQTSCLNLLAQTQDSPLYFLSCLEAANRHEAFDLVGLISEKATASGHKMVEFAVGNAKFLYVRGKIEDHSGQILVDHASPNTRFVIRLPKVRQTLSLQKAG